MRFVFGMFSAFLRLMWRLVYIIALVALLFVGSLYIMSPSKTNFVTILQQDVRQLYRYINGQDRQRSVGQHVKDITKQLSDNHVHHLVFGGIKQVLRCI